MCSLVFIAGVINIRKDLYGLQFSDGSALSSRYCFIKRDARSAKCGIAIVSRPSVCPSVRPSVRDVDVSWSYRLD